MQSDFKNINVVPIGNEFFDLVHSQTPNLLPRKGFRQFYTREVKKTELSIREKLSTIIQQFPLKINPFYTHLLRSIFDKDRYKLALGQVSTAKHLITKIANDSVKRIEFSESSKQCKTLKVSAVGRMFNVVNEITPGLAYLEQIRQHMVKLPSIDLNSPTLLVSGYPNVDKACFMNRISTKSSDDCHNFVVGVTDYKDLMYQVIDAPGALDRCNVISALACHLQASLVVFFLDVSCSCGYSIAYQAALIYSLKSLFVNKPVLIVCDESDLTEVSEQDWRFIDDMSSGMRGEEEEEVVVLKIRNLSTEEGVMCVKNAACERLLDQIERLSSCIDQEKVDGLRNKCILAVQEWKDGIISHNLHEDDDDKDSGLLVDSDGLFSLEELEREEGLKQAEEEEEEGFVMAEECFGEELNDQQLVAIYRGDMPSSIAQQKVECLRNIIPQNLEDDHNVSDLLVDSERGGEEEEDSFVMAEESFKEDLRDQHVAINRGGRPSCTAREKVECWRNKYILAHQERPDDIIPQNLDDDHNVSDLLVCSERKEGLEKAEEEEDGFVMAEEHFTAEHNKDHQLVSIRKIQPLGIFIAIAFFVLVGNTYGAIQQCLSTLSLRVYLVLVS